MKKFYIPISIVFLLLIVIVGMGFWYFGIHRFTKEIITTDPAKETSSKKVALSEAEGQNMEQQSLDTFARRDSNVVDTSDDGESSEHEIPNGDVGTPSAPKNVETSLSQEVTSIDPELAALLEETDVLLEETEALEKELGIDSERDEHYVKRAFSSLANRFKMLSSEKKREVLNDVEDMFLNPERFVSHLQPNFRKSYIELLENMGENPEFKKEVQTLLSDILRE